MDQDKKNVKHALTSPTDPWLEASATVLGFPCAEVEKFERIFAPEKFRKTSFESDLDRAAAHAVYPRFLRFEKCAKNSPRRLHCQFFKTPLPPLVQGAPINFLKGT
ncbi:hypothetical protein Tsp_14534, partial [Trichinella spiralis]|uniref:hypothetical protein n=1 Tax=Trichinella spiralis TaxID=6334 RepID=UPI0001EFEFB2